MNGYGTEAIVSEGKHAPGCKKCNGFKAFTIEGSVDVSLAMKDFVKECAVNNDNHTDLPDMIWNDTVAHFCACIGNNFTGVTESHIRSLLYNALDSSFGGDVASNLEQL